MRTSGSPGRSRLLESIIAPSSVVAEKYRSDVIVTRDGRVITGSISTAADYALRF